MLYHLFLVLILLVLGVDRSGYGGIVYQVRMYVLCRNDSYCIWMLVLAAVKQMWPYWSKLGDSAVHADAARNGRWMSIRVL